MAFSDFTEYKNATSSQKNALAWIEPSTRLFDFTLDSGAIYKRTTTNYVVGVAEDDTTLTQASSAVLGAGEWFYDDATSIMYVRMSDDSDPITKFITATYRLFFSSIPVNLAYDLSAGRQVEYSPRISSVSKFKNSIDPVDQVGIAITGNGSIVLNNNDGFFDDKFDKLFWENKRVRIFSYNSDLPSSDAKIIYDGTVSDKSFGEKSITFRIKDFVESLRESLSIDLYDGTEGDIPDSVIGSSKRRIYGRANVRAQGTNLVLDGYDMTGTAVITANNKTINVTGGDLLNDLSPEDTVFYQSVNLAEEVELKVESIASGLTFTVSEDPPESISVSLKIRPEIPNRAKNRTFLVAGHALKEPTTSVVSSFQLNRIKVVQNSDFNDFEAGDTIFIGTDEALIRRISGDVFILEQNLPGIPAASTAVVKNSVQDCFLASRELVFSRDYTIDASTAILTLDTLAEFNVIKPVALSGTATFTNGSRTITGSGTSFRDLKPRDWIKADLTSQWLEVLSVDSDTQIVVRVSFSEATIGTTFQVKKTADVIASDDTIVTVDALGKTEDGTKTGVYIKTGAQAVKDLLTEMGLSDRFNVASFSTADIEAPYLMSLALPTAFNGNAPDFRSVINLVNGTVFGALHYNNDLEIAYSVLSAKKPTADEIIKDDDVISWSVQSNGKNIARFVNVNYQHFDADRFTGEKGSKTISLDSEVVRRLNGTSRTDNKDIYLFRDSDAEIIAERLLFFRQTASTSLTLRTKLKFIDAAVNDVIYFELDRIFERFGTTNDQNRIGMISSVTKGPEGTDIIINDLSGFYNKVANVASNTATVHSAAEAQDKAFNGYFTDNNGRIDDLEETYLTNLIG